MEKVRLRIDEDFFTNVYWKIKSVDTRFRIVYGGTGSSKSVSVAQDEVLKGLESKQGTLIIRKEASSLKDSVYKSFKNRIDEFGCASYMESTLKPMDITLTNTGTMFMFRGIDDPEKLKSFEGITRIVIEEANALDYHDFLELNRRARGIKGIQITIVFNPVDEDHWIKKHFFDAPKKNATIIHSTHWDNPFLTQEDHDEIEAMKDIDENQYNIYALGLWGKLKTGSEFLPKFSYVKHTGKASFLKNKTIHASFDFNVLPYMPCVLAQIQENVVRWRNPVTKQRFKQFEEGCEMEHVTQVRFFKNVLGKSNDFPDNSATSVCEYIVQNYGDYNLDLFYYGDASGDNRTAGKGDGTNFDDIRGALASMITPASNRVPRSNPSVMKARNFINRVLADRYPIEVLIDEDECSELARDLSTIMLGSDGVKKEMVKDKQTGISYQKNSHLHDAFKYLIIWLFYDLFIEAK